MRLSIALVLALAAVGCASPPRDKPSDQAVECMAYLGLQSRVSADEAARLSPAIANWRTIALVTMTGPQVDAYYNVSFAAYQDQPPNAIRETAERCFKRAPKNKPSRR